MLNAVAAVVIAALLLWWRHWVPLLLAIGFGASTLGAFVISATVGLFGVHELLDRRGGADRRGFRGVGHRRVRHRLVHEYGMPDRSLMRHPLALRHTPTK